MVTIPLAACVTGLTNIWKTVGVRKKKEKRGTKINKISPHEVSTLWQVHLAFDDFATLDRNQ
jgi:hypothetical protein